MKKKKIKYIFKKIFLIVVIAFLSIIIYQLFMELKINSNKEENYGMKLSAEEEKSEQENISTIIEKVSSKVVGISKIKNTGTAVFLPNSSQNLGMGSGIIVSSKGYILTNQHVIGEKNKSCYVTIQNGENYIGKILWANADIDLAIIKVEKTFAKEAILGNSDSIRVGEPVYAIGNPIGFEFERTVTGGIISAVNRTVKIKNEDETYSYMSNLIQTDATINPGNSGGPLINNEGNIIGINTIKITTAEGIGFAIPINVAKPIVENFEKYGTFEEAYMGIYAYDGSIISYLNDKNEEQNGVIIEKIVESSPAAKTGLQKGDRIIKVDATNISKMSELQEYIFSKNPGDEIMVTIKRNQKEIEIRITLEKKD